MRPPATDFQRFFAAEHGGVVRSLTLAFGDRQVAEDAAQEGFSQALARWGQVRKMESPAGWVYTVAFRYERRRLTRWRRGGDAFQYPESRDDTAAAADRLLVVSLLRLLTERQRRAVVLRYHADLRLEDIADALGCSLGTVKATLHQAVARMGVSAERDKSDADR